MINVLHSCGQWLPLTETWIYNPLNRLHKYGVHCEVVCEELINIDKYPFPNVHVARQPGILDMMLRKSLRISGIRPWLPLTKELLERGNFNILHSHFGPIGFNNAVLAHDYGIPHIVSFYGVDVSKTPKSPLWKKKYELLFDKMALALCEGPFMAQALVNLGADPAKVKVQRLGTDLASIPFQERNWKQGDTLRILIAGSFREKKGIPYAVEAVGLLAKNYPNIRLCIVGDAGRSNKDQHEKSKILRLIDRYDLKSKVDLKGFLPYDQLLGTAKDFDIFLSPSISAKDGDTEGGAPLTIIEMAASGMPVVSTTHCDIPFVLSVANHSLLASERDPHRLKEILLQLIHQPSLFAEIGLENRKFIDAELDIEKTSASLASIYKDLATI